MLNWLDREIDLKGFSAADKVWEAARWKQYPNFDHLWLNEETLYYAVYHFLGRETENTVPLQYEVAVKKIEGGGAAD